MKMKGADSFPRPLPIDSVVYDKGGRIDDIFFYDSLLNKSAAKDRYKYAARVKKVAKRMGLQKIFPIFTSQKKLCEPT